jgi:hypothetical protein
MAEDLVPSRTGLEFFVTVLAVLVGFVAAKYLSKFLSGVGVPIAAGDPVPLTLPGQAPLPWRRAA